MGILYVMWLRQLKRYWRSKPRMIGMLGLPLLFLVALGFGFGPIYQKAGGGDYMQFLAPGVTAMTILFAAMFSDIEVIWDRQFGFLKETLVAPVSRLQIMLGRILGGATVAVIQGIIVLAISLLVGFRVSDLILLPLALFFMFLIALLFTALGTAIASMLEDMQAFPLIINFIIMPLFFLSGALFPIENIPRALEITLNLNPLTYGIDGLRASLNGASHFGLGLDLGVMVVVTLIISLIGTYSFERIEI